MSTLYKTWLSVETAGISRRARFIVLQKFCQKFLPKQTWSVPFNLIYMYSVDSDSSRAPGLTSVLQGSVNVYRGALLLVPQWQCISSFVFYIFCRTCSLCRVELVVQFPARGSTQELLYLFPGVLWLWRELGWAKARFRYEFQPQCGSFLGHHTRTKHIYLWATSPGTKVE